MRISMPVLVLLVSSIGWGFTWLPLHYFAGTGLAGPMLISIAFGSAMLCLLPALLWQYSTWRNSLRLLCLIALFGGLANVSFQTAIYHGDVVRVMILFYLLPIWSVLGGRIFLREKIDGLRMATLAAAISGGFLILGGAAIIESPPNWIDLLAILSGFSLAMNNILFRASPSIPLLSKVAAMFIGVALMMAAYLAFDREAISLPDTSVSLFAVLYGAGWIMLITLGTQWSVTYLEAGRAAIIIVLELVVAVVSSVLILGTTLGLAEIAGAVLVTVAALLEGGRQEQPPPAKQYTELLSGE